MAEARLEVAMLVGAESKQWLLDLTKLVERMEKVTGKKTKTSEPEDKEEEVSEDDDFAPAAKKRGRPKKAASFDDEEEETELAADDGAEDAEDEDEEETDEISAADLRKSTKAKKVTLDAVNDACKARVASIMERAECSGKEARGKVLLLLKRKFGVESVSELKPAQYADVVAVMTA